MADYGFGISSSGTPFRNEIEAWNDPARQAQSDFNLAMARNDFASAKLYQDNLSSLLGLKGIGIQAEASKKVSETNSAPNLIIAEKGSKLVDDPTATKQPVQPNQPAQSSLSPQAPSVAGGIQPVNPPAIPPSTSPVSVQKTTTSSTAPEMKIGSGGIFEEIFSKRKQPWSIGGIGNVFKDNSSFTMGIK